MIKKLIYGLLNLLSALAIAVALVVLLTVLFTRQGQAPNILGFSALRVLTGSMEPEIHTDSLILVRRTDPEEICVGDVLSFYSADPELGGAINTHRVVDVAQQDGEWVFTTKGDANPIADSYPVTKNALVGRVVFVSYRLGRLVQLLSQPLSFLLLVAIPLLGMVIYNLAKVIHSAVRVMKQEEQAAVQQALADLQQIKAKAAAEQAALQTQENSTATTINNVPPPQQHNPD